MRRTFPILTAVSAAAFLFATMPADAQQERSRTRITVTPKSYLDPGTKVQPGSMHYHRYAFPLESQYPSYGPYAAGTGSYGGSRYPMLRIFEGGGF
jgi:hypothetical protein